MSNKTFPDGPIHFYYFIHCVHLYLQWKHWKSVFPITVLSATSEETQEVISPHIWWKHKYTNKHIKYAFISLGFVLSQWRTMLLTNRKSRSISQGQLRKDWGGHASALGAAQITVEGEGVVCILHALISWWQCAVGKREWKPFLKNESTTISGPWTNLLNCVKVHLRLLAGLLTRAVAERGVNRSSIFISACYRSEAHAFSTFFVDSLPP